jgi:hypothetical protein
MTVKPKVMDVRVDFGKLSMSLIGLNRDLPFINIKALDIIFSDNVNVSTSMLQLLGVNVSSYSFSLSYNPKTFDATVTFPSALGVDRLMLSLNGETAAPVSGSGPNIAANPFQNNFAVLPGDVNGDGVVNLTDVLAVRSQITSGTYLIWADVNGDGVVDLNDFNEVRKRLGSHLPG